MVSSTGQVIIAGGGPVGLVSALALARAGIPVVVLEAAASLPQEERGAAFHPPTLEILDALGVTPDLLAIGLKVPVWQIRAPSTGQTVSFDLSLLAEETRHPYRFHLGQHRLSQVLLEHLRRYPEADLRFGWKLTGFEQDADGIVATAVTGGREERIAGRWLIGADGAHSTVRRALGIEFSGFTWPERFLVTNIAADLEAHGFSRTNYVSDPDHWAVILMLTEGDAHRRATWRVTYPTDTSVPDAEVLEPGEVHRRLSEVLSLPGEAFDLRLAATYRVHQRVAETFRSGRALLAGDAAHINNPLGGFGLNSGIHDASALAEALTAVWRGEAGDEALDRYVRQRLHANRTYIQASSIRNKKLLEERDLAVRRTNMDQLSAIAESPALARDYLLNSSMILSVREARAVP